MSRSYKKNPVSKDGGRSKKWGKNQANRRVRHSDTFCLTYKSGYKKIFNQWNICDYHSRETWNDVLAYRKRCVNYSWFDPDDIKVERQRWEKYYFRK